MTLLRTTRPQARFQGAMKDIVISVATQLSHDEGADYTVLQAKVQNIYFTLDGSVPSSTNGFILAVGSDPLIIDLVDNQVIKVINAAAGSRLVQQDMKYIGWSA